VIQCGSKIGRQRSQRKGRQWCMLDSWRRRCTYLPRQATQTVYNSRHDCIAGHNPQGDGVLLSGTCCGSTRRAELPSVGTSMIQIATSEPQIRYDGVHEGPKDADRLCTGLCILGLSAYSRAFPENYFQSSTRIAYSRILVLPLKMRCFQRFQQSLAGFYPEIALFRSL
jgi:hypothetical protein